VSQAIWYFLKQDHARRELIVVDDGADSVEDLIPKDSRICYVRQPAPVPTAASATMAAISRRGTLSPTGAADAWYSPARLRAHVAQFEDEGIDAAALAGLLHYQPLTGRVWRYAPAAGATARVRAAGLAHRRSYWNEHRFSETVRDEIRTFVRAMPSERSAGGLSGG
jgi:hypothetical protein